MSFRYRPLGPVMTEDDYMTGAMERPLSPWQTFKGAVADATLASPGIGTAIREFSTPATARKTETIDLGPAPAGRGMPARRTHTRLGYKTAAEVEAEGDTLYETPDQFKASPSYRPDIPFEKGMTASRAKALAEMYDTSEVRKFYGSKRPVTAFLGTVAGTALDPINYIPIAGEVAAAAATARVGRIAGRALVGSADAAANTALFGALTAGERAQYGDDVSWAAIGTNAAYAALAGAAIGGAIGGVSKFRHWSHNRPQPAVPQAAVQPPAAVARETLSTSGAATGKSVPVRTAGEGVNLGTLDTAGVATAKSAPVRNVSVDSVLSRLETAGMRTKAAEVMNDAIDGLVNNGEVRLGERSQGHIAEMQGKAADAEFDGIIPEGTGGFKFVEIAQDPLPDGLAPPPGWKQFTVVNDGKEILRVGMTIDAQGGANIGYINNISKTGEPPRTAAMRQIRNAFANQFPDVKKITGLRVTGARRGIEDRFVEHEVKRNYALPAPDPIPQGLAAATSRIEANVKANAEPVKMAFTGTSTKIKQTGPEAKAEPEDPLLTKEGDWREDTVRITADGKPAMVKAGAAVDMLTSRMKAVNNLLDCIRAG